MDGAKRQYGAEIVINKILFVITFAAVGALAYGWYYNNQRIIMAQEVFIEKFINAGPRFTAYDGQELCERIRELELYSYDYKNTDRKPLNCHYSQSK